MVTEDYVSFEVAKLLKEKGFDQNCATYYLDGHVWRHYHGEVIPKGKQIYAAPSQAIAMKWLREVHNILIVIIPMEIKIGVERLCYGIYRITEDLYQPLYNGKINNLVDSYEESVEAALKYTLENLI